MPLYGEEKRQYQLKWVQERRDRGHALLGGKCAKCGIAEGLEVDHIVPEDKHASLKRRRTQGFNWSRSWSFIEEELKKCQLLCDECHNAKSKKESTTRTHGLTMYKKDKCRCPICRKAMSVQNARRCRKST